MRLPGIVLLVSFVFHGNLMAQPRLWRFRWETGQVLTYRVKHQTSVSESIQGAAVKTTSKLNLVKRWQVLKVNEAGTATLQLSLLEMRNEQLRPNGETLLFDSKNLDKSTPALRKHMSKFIGTTLAIIRVDDKGKVLEAKKGSLAKYLAEPPFVVTLPVSGGGVGQVWQRNYRVHLRTGEKYKAVQSYRCKSIQGTAAVIEIQTAFLDQPESKLDLLPLFPKEISGEVVFDLAAGRMRSTELTIQKELQGHQGKGSSYLFTSSFREELVSGKK